MNLNSKRKRSFYLNRSLNQGKRISNCWKYNNNLCILNNLMIRGNSYLTNKITMMIKLLMKMNLIYKIMKTMLRNSKCMITIIVNSLSEISNFKVKWVRKIKILIKQTISRHQILQIIWRNRIRWIHMLIKTIRWILRHHRKNIR